jgi:C4-dicarboxylate-specific signal transduction histidine kinase
MAEAATRMHVTVDGMFQALGKVLQSDVRAALEHALERARQDYSQVEFACSGAQASPIVFGATADLANIFENLLANGARAALATRDLRAPRVEVECVREGGLLLLLFRDTGPGIPPGTLEAAMARTTLTPGRHGRGLPYALRRLHQFDGKLQVLSSLEDQGTVMAVSLRILASVPAQAAAPGKPHAEESHEELQHPHRG